MALAVPALTTSTSEKTAAATGAGAPTEVTGGVLVQPVVPPETAKRSSARYLWAMLIARIYEVFPLVCPICAGQVRLIAFITDGAEVRKVLDHIGADSQAPRITPARGPPLWDDCDAPVGKGVEAQPEWDASIQITPDYQVDQLQ